MNIPIEPRHFDLGSAEFLANPYPVYRRLRDQSPVFRHRQGFWFVSRYSDVRAALNDPRFSNRPAPLARVAPRNKGRFAAADVANGLMAFNDASDHIRLRRPFSRALAETRSKACFDLEDLAAECLGNVQRGSPFDLVSEFATPFSALAACKLFGLPRNEIPDLLRYSLDFFRLFHSISDAETFERLNRSLVEFRQLMSFHFERAVDGQGADLLCEVARQFRSADISPAEAIDNLMLVFADAIGNVQAGIANCALVLMNAGGAAPELADPETQLSRIIEECLRLESPGQHQARIVLEDTELQGRSLRRNSVVLLSFASANRDESVFEAADQFDPTRSGKQPLSFGEGPHKCLGASLVHAEIAAALRVLFSQSRRLSPAGVPPKWLPRAGHRWLASLPMVFED